MNCHACKCHVTPVQPKTMWKVLSVVFWVACLTVALPLSIVIGLNIVLAPLAIAIGFAIGTSTRRLTSWTCPRCHAELLEPEPQTEFATLPQAV